MDTLFLAWQDSAKRKWFPVGRLTRGGGHYHFAYINGALDAQLEAGFQPLPSMPDFRETYRSAALFPLFSNRLLPRSRPEYDDVITWLSLPHGPVEPFAFLARSGGHRATDTFEVFPEPRIDETGHYNIDFLVHGLRHFAAESIARAESLRPGERLLLLHDFQNQSDPNALMLRTSEDHPYDLYPVGYCPRYLSEEMISLVREAISPTVVVYRVNPPPAPVHFRLLCRMRIKASARTRLFAGSRYKSIGESRAAGPSGSPPPQIRKVG